MEDRMEQFALRLTEDELSAVRAFARTTDTSMNDVIRRAIREYLAGDARREEFNALLEQTKERYAVALDKLADL
jgi:hypothetical protein